MCVIVRILSLSSFTQDLRFCVEGGAGDVDGDHVLMIRALSASFSRLAVLEVEEEIEEEDNNSNHAIRLLVCC